MILKYKTIIILLAVLFVMACHDEEKIPFPDLNDHVGAITLVTLDPDPAKSFYNLLNPLATEEVAFTLDVDGFDITTINSVDLELEYTEKDGKFDVFRQEYVDSVYAKVTLGNVTSFPAQFSFTAEEVAGFLGKQVSDFELGDSFIITFPINTGDGRRLVVALDSELCNEPAQPSAGGCSVQWSITCPALVKPGNYTFELVSTNASPSDFSSPINGAITQISPGTYQLSEGVMNLFGTAVRMRFTEVCNEITVQPASSNFPTLVIFDQLAGTTFDPVTGIITFDIVLNSATCCGAAGISYRFTATPQ